MNGTLAEGTITAPDPGNACGWVDLAAVLAAIGSGDTYVNVHTNDGVWRRQTPAPGLPRRGDPRPGPVARSDTAAGTGLDRVLKAGQEQEGETTTQ